jgi:hypothetical protein
VERTKNITPRNASRLDDLRAWHVVFATCAACGKRTHIDARLLQHGRPPHQAARSRAEASLQQLRQSSRQHLERHDGAAELNAAHRFRLARSIARAMSAAIWPWLARKELA